MIIDIDDEANNWCYSFPFSGTDVNTWYLLFYFIFICFAFIILCLHRCYNAKLCLFISEFIDSIAPFCTDIMVLGIVTLVCTDVMMQGYYLFIFNSGMDCNIPSQRCGRLYFPMFLFNVGLFTLMYIASFTALAILWSSLPILTFSTDVMWPVLFWCSCIGDGAFRCSLYLSSKLLVDSPIYSSSQSILSHLNQYIILLFFLMLSLSLGDTSKFLIVFPPLKYTCIPYFLQMFLKLSLIPWEYGNTIWHILFVVIDVVSSCWSCLVGVLVYGGSSLLPTWDICNLWGLFPNVPILCWWTLVWNIKF